MSPFATWPRWAKPVRTGEWWAGKWPWLIFFLAFLPRLAALRRYVTPDELNWVYRSLGLRRALLAGNWAETIQSGHPGITTTWIGALSAQLQVWVQPTASDYLAWLDHLYVLAPDNVEAYRHLYPFLSGGRLGVALVSSLGIVLIFYLAHSLFGFRAALMGALLLALDPFYAGLSGLLHVDALLALLMTLTLLLVLQGMAAEGRLFYLYALLAGISTGLALLTKTPALFLLPLVLALLGGVWLVQKRTVSSLFLWLLLWGGSLVAVLLFALPALWADPRSVLNIMTGLTGRLVEDAVRPSYFMGRESLDHGPVFYPVALLFRLSPAASLGLIAACLCLLRPDLKEKGVKSRVGLLLLYSALFVLFITLVAKKHDRYALPAVLPLLLAAGWGIDRMARWFRQKGWHSLGKSLPVLAVLLQAFYLAAALPYPLTAYNWLAGGNRVAYQVLPAGWGEGASAMARWLSANLPRPEQSTLFTTNLTGAAPFFPGQILRLQTEYLPYLEQDDFLLLTTQDQQSASALKLPREAEVTYQTTFNGLQGAALYTGLQAADFGLPSLSRHPRSLRAGQAVELAESGALFLPWPQKTVVRLGWQTVPGVPLSESYRLQLQLLDESDQVWLTQEVPLLNSKGQMPFYWSPGVPQPVTYLLAIPSDTPPGSYHLLGRLFDADGALLGVFDEQRQFAGAGMTLADLAVRPPLAQPSLDIPQRIGADETVPEGSFAGYAAAPERVGTGERLVLDLWWQAAQIGQSLPLTLWLGDRQLETVVTTEGWVPGQTYHIRPAWRVPPDLPAGRYPVRVTAGEGETTSIIVGELLVEAVERDFELPPGLAPLAVRLGNIARLQAVETQVTDEAVVVDVVWQAAQPDETNYTAFVHLRDAEGAIVAQADRLLQPLTGSWVEGQVVVERYRLARPAGGLYSLALGLYDADSGQRVPLYEEDGTPLPGAHYLVETAVP